jgi:hypothetical protein
VPGAGNEQPGHADLGRRFAWLLLTHRLRADPAYADPARFAVALTEAGGGVTPEVSADEVLGWEAAAELPPYDVVAAWEQVCGLTDGWLVTVGPFLASSVSEVSPVWPDPLPSAGTRGQELMASVVNGTAADADRVAQDLVTQLPRSVGVAYRRLSIAAAQLCTLPDVQDAVVTRIRQQVAHGVVQQPSDPVRLLANVPTRASAALVLEMLERPPTRTLLPVVVWVATRKLVQGQFTDAERARLEVAVLTRWRSGAHAAQRELAELIAALPEGVRNTLVRAAADVGVPTLGHVMEHGEEDSATPAAKIAAEVAATALAAAPGNAPYDESPLLTQLVREALFHHRTERRHLAAVLLETSPFRGGVADQVVALLGSVEDRALRIRAATLACYVTGESHRMRLHRFLEDRQASVAMFATYALGRLPYAVTTDLALRRGLPTKPTPAAQARLHALGMTGSPVLATLASRTGAAEWQRRAAEWWLAGGPAIR